MANYNETVVSEELPVKYIEDIQIRISGQQMNKAEGYNLSEVLATLSSFENASKKVYLSLVGKSKFSYEDKEDFTIRLMDVSEGSFLSECKIIYSSVIIPLVPVVVENKEVIWNTVKASYDFLKAKLSAKREGKEVSVNQTASEQGVNVYVDRNTGDNLTINVYPGIPEQALRLVPEFTRISKQIDGQKVNSIELSSSEKSEQKDVIFFDQQDKEIFSKRTFTEDRIFSLKGKIIDGAYSKLSGRIEVTETETDLVQVGNSYRFTVNSNLRSEEIWKQMFLEERPYYCKKRVEYDPSCEEVLKILEIIIVDWDENKWVS